MTHSIRIAYTIRSSKAAFTPTQARNRTKHQFVVDYLSKQNGSQMHFFAIIIYRFAPPLSPVSLRLPVTHLTNQSNDQSVKSFGRSASHPLNQSTILSICLYFHADSKPRESNGYLHTSGLQNPT